jgi:thiamine biosynthesis protein ThiS
MTITVNGRRRDVPDGTTIATFLRDIGLSPRGVAVERNACIVRPERFDQTVLGEGDVVEIVRFVGGG